MSALPVVAFDWSGRDVQITTDGVNTKKLLTLWDILSYLDTPHTIVGESTFESFLIEMREKFIKDCLASGHVFKYISPRATAHRRMLLGLEKTDENDVRVIYNLATDGKTHLKSPSVTPDQDYLDRFRAASRELMLLRRTASQHAYARHIKQLLGRPRDLTLAQQMVRKSDTTLSTIAVVANNVSSRSEFERMIGLYQQGYPGIFRSNIHHHAWPAANRQGISWTEFRKALRWAYHVIKISSQGT